MSWKDMLPDNADDLRESLDKKTIVVLIVGILAGVVYVDGIPLSYSKVQFEVHDYSHFEFTKTKLPLMKTSITIEYMVTDDEKYDDDYEQECFGTGSLYSLMTSLNFMDSNDEIIWTNADFDLGLVEDEDSVYEYRTGDPNVEIDRRTINHVSCGDNDQSIWSVKIKMNGEPVKVTLTSEDFGVAVRIF